MMGYQKLISEISGITDPKRLAEIEETMREDIFHSTLDWQPRKQFAKGVREAIELLKATEQHYGKLA